jgi:hypothetical protein
MLQTALLRPQASGYNRDVWWRQEMSRKHMKNWPDCLGEKSLEELHRLLEGFHTKARVWPAVRKACMKSARLVEKEIARREAPPDSD